MESWRSFVTEQDMPAEQSNAAAAIWNDIVSAGMNTASRDLRRVEAPRDFTDLGWAFGDLFRVAIDTWLTKYPSYFQGDLDHPEKLKCYNTSMRKDNTIAAMAGAQAMLEKLLDRDPAEPAVKKLLTANHKNYIALLTASLKHNKNSMENLALWPIAEKARQAAMSCGPLDG